MATPVKPPLEKLADGAAPRPRGRDEIVDAVLDAAERLFARSGPASVSLRDIATEADVTYSLISRHFGTKDDLFDLLLARYARRWQERSAGDLDLATALVDLLGPEPAQGAYLRLLAWSLLSGTGGRPQGAASLLDRLVPLARAEAPTDHDALTDTAAGLALVFGWRFFHPFITAALHVPDAAVVTLHTDIARRLTPTTPAAGRNANENANE